MVWGKEEKHKHYSSTVLEIAQIIFIFPPANCRKNVRTSAYKSYSVINAIIWNIISESVLQKHWS